MKTSSKTIGLSIRLGALAAALLFGQQAMAEGTRAGTVVDNTATVDYFVGGIDQTDITSNTVSFVVDRRVNLAMVPTSTPDLESVNPGQAARFADFLLTNTSNSDLDIDLVLANAANGTNIDGTANDDADMTDPRIAVWTDFESGTPAAPADPGAGTTTATIDDIPADEAIRIRVWGDAGLALVDGAVAGLEVTATALATDGSALAYGVANTDGLENVDVNGNGGVVVSNDGFIVETADLTVVKAYTVLSDPLGSGLAIPGAVIEYTVTITNASTTTDATDVSIADALDDNVDFNTGQYNGNDIEIDNDGTVTECSADAAAGDTDGCSLDGVNLVVGNANGPITVAADTILVVTYQVTIQDPAITP
ncbi:MAG: hypothetical protein QNJ14_06230 [Woeseiaceae bacterium]|nr:hypothetical protein [Woeseiaceae bacterium]